MPFEAEVKYYAESEVWHPSSACSSAFATVSDAIDVIYASQGRGGPPAKFYRVVDVHTQRVVAVWSETLLRFISVTHNSNNPPYYVEYFSGEWYRSMDLWRAYETIFAASTAITEHVSNDYSSSSYRVVDNDGTPVWFQINRAPVTTSTPSNQPIQPNSEYSYSAKDNMPETIFSPPMLASAADIESPPLVDVTIVRSKPTNRLSLQISAKPLHDYLESIGVETRGNEFVDQPATSFNVVNGEMLSTKLFLRREYPVTVDLSSIFRDPPTPQRLLNVARSANAVVKSILAHYQPVDIKISIHKRVG